MINSYPTINIDWILLAKAVDYYNNHDYYQIETPFAIPEFYHFYTKPHHDQTFVLKDGLFKSHVHELVGSAEQGFIYLLVNNKLDVSKKLFSVTPCFRYDNYDKLHQPWFMKLELFHYSSHEQDLTNMIDTVKKFYEMHSELPVNIVQTSEKSFDLEINNIEVGSYGFRHIENHTFIYGTGLALPRFSITTTIGE